MRLAIKDNTLSFMYRCPNCKNYVIGMTPTHPWRLCCDKCKIELQNPEHPEYYPKPLSNGGGKK